MAWAQNKILVCYQKYFRHNSGDEEKEDAQEATTSNMHAKGTDVWGTERNCLEQAMMERQG